MVGNLLNFQNMILVKLNKMIMDNEVYIEYRDNEMSDCKLHKITETFDVKVITKTITDVQLTTVNK